jgi:two-component system, OmpR family, response regulator MprA
MPNLKVWLMAKNPGLKDRWSRRLTEEGWSVVDVPSSGTLTSLSRTRPAGPALLDASLLKEKDADLVRGLHQAKIPVILFGEGPEAANDRIVRWLEAGADDFIPASIHERVLTAKLQAYARRLLPAMDRIVLTSPHQRVKADSERGLAWIKEGEGWKLTPPLTKTEFALLRLFLSMPEKPLEKRFILETLWGEKAADIFPATLTQHVMSLRKKLGTAGHSLRTVYGQGYIFLEGNR